MSIKQNGEKHLRLFQIALQHMTVVFYGSDINTDQSSTNNVL